MLSSFYSAISGLSASTTGINVVSNNIANMNTVGYKSSTATFKDVLYQTIHSSSGTSQVGRGTAVSSVRTDFSAGSLETTNSTTDLAIGGDGFFIVRDPDSATAFYTRAGSFSFDSDGNLVDSDGNIVQGWEIDRTTGTRIGVYGDVIISQAPSEPRATETIDMNVNLQSDADWAGDIGDLTGTGTAISAVTASDGEYPVVGDYSLSYNAGTGALTVTVTDASGVPHTYTDSSITLEAGTTYTNFGGSGLDITTAGTSSFPTTGTSTQGVDITGFDVSDATATSNYSSSISVYDSLGQAHTVNVYFRKSGEDSSGQSTWDWYAELDGADSATGQNEIAGSGTLTFNSNGVLVSGGNAQTVTFNFSGAAEGDQTIDIVFGSDTGGGTTTQYPIASTTNYSTQDGYAPGTLESVSVSSDGTISGTYSNGQIIELYQITLADFNNPDGLKKEGSNLYSETLESGVAYTNAAGEGGLGSISSNSLEQSNVDLASEFVKLIIYQRGFQANSTVITTTDEVLQTLIGLKR
ncbi:MAG: Flagellar hook protein FlgE [Syntrophorhabdus sp. PtaB.Bin006]|nr:MAG: Flagellar hook protein FlgE [Syntrophorhabdus sp. PtaB.Bin006]